MTDRPTPGSPGENPDGRRDARGNGPGRVVRLDLPDGFTAAHGGRLHEIEVAYEAWGTLDSDRANAVAVIHPLTFDPHVTGEWAGQPRGWWEPLVGPGRAIDTDRHFVVCPNLLGSCFGTTGPRSPAPDGAPWLERFPLLTPRDLARFVDLFLRALAIERPGMVIGASMGGMVAWEWAIENGDRTGLTVIVAAPLRTTPHQIGLNWLQRRGVELDLEGDEALARWGQMVARGVGMLSYRSPIGLDEKFGREWTKAPGPTLGERGMFNVESWLRHHGKRAAKSFDPYTYLLLSRAMDLHDVGEGRGGVMPALDRVGGRTLAVGISSDHLYPPAEVHLGADILQHLGKPVEYDEIRSPHGHDAFLLETGQIGAILRAARERGPAPVITAAARAARVVRVGILGAGRVAAEFVRLLAQRAPQLADDPGLRFEVAAIADVDRHRTFDPVFAAHEVGFDPDGLVVRSDVDAVVALTRGTTVLGPIEQALRRGRPVVTTNKPLVRAHGARLERLALEHGVRLAYHNAIAAGWPLLYAVERPLLHGEVRGIAAVLSSTCNVVLEGVERGATVDEGLAEARARGLTEPDPELDLTGWDTAQKLTMLIACASGRRYLVEELHVEGLGGLDPRLVRAAPDLGLRVKLVALFTPGAARDIAAVLPAAVPAEGHLGAVHGEDNVVVLDRGDEGEMVQIGRGSGVLPVATAALNDLIGLFHAPRSWTGRARRAPTPPDAPRFTRWLSIENGAAAIGASGTVPVLGGVL